LIPLPGQLPVSAKVGETAALTIISCGRRAGQAPLLSPAAWLSLVICFNRRRNGFMRDLLADLDFFDTFRWLLAIVCTVYAVIVTWNWLWCYLQWFGSSRELKRVGSYAAVLLLRTRIWRFGLELLQIAALTVLFFYIVYLHQLIEAR
jgi:hypothetical protein